MDHRRDLRATSSVPKADGDVAGIHPVLGATFLNMVKMLLSVSIQPRPDIQILYSYQYQCSKSCIVGVRKTVD